MVGSEDPRGGDPDLNALGELWRRNEPATDTLAAEVRTRGWLMRATVAVEILVTLAAGGVGVWAISLGTSSSLLAGAFSLAFAGFAIAVSWGAHRGEAWSADGLAVRDQLEAATRQAQAIRRWAWSGYGISGGAVIFLGVMLLGPGRSGSFPWLIAAAAVAYIVAAVALCAWIARRQTLRLERLEDLRRILFDDGPPGGLRRIVR